MKPGLLAGMTHTRRFEMNEDRTISFMGEALRIYSTPFMMQDVE